ncbi:MULTISPECIES: 4-amino-4-deoxy-L-arabinose-phospho-UDP flippase [unclassified Mesorhizobium]|uniref:4-amino-4-deoxy-L-arabinose-phospho-UDP flippase n=1 Tax=unclassified Mesorhizobium TaxID=325217 RepID=UPI000BB04C4C|nr:MULTISPECIES: 4-amino-4-deoxy-L-arabinose-phospho-UDP flippase [unclassified Mesorhizobium]PBC23461.1 4-amino-4-deoxy-L-arabinose-phospho-UDP flippase [Mesorhizobium sp. WSM4311]TRD06826.1 4-amino-4-deoxy-L-arabinose-phospho-UDP flippase [Mesorhizobium sp. WSM4305]
MSNIFSYVLVAFCVCALAAGQIIFKVVSGRIHSLSDILLNTGTLMFFASAVALYGGSTLAWIIALRTIPLSQAYLFMAFGFVIVPVAAHFLLGEPLGSNVFFGAALICVGVWIAAS